LNPAPFAPPFLPVFKLSRSAFLHCDVQLLAGIFPSLSQFFFFVWRRKTKFFWLGPFRSGAGLFFPQYLSFLSVWIPEILFSQYLPSGPSPRAKIRGPLLFSAPCGDRFEPSDLN